MAFYVIETNYVGPDKTNDSDMIDADFFRIQTQPGRKNLSMEDCVSGWLGCTNDFSETAHGEFDSLESAISKISALTSGEYREETALHDWVFQCRPGRLIPMTAADSETWCYESMRDVIAHCTPDDEIESWAADCARDAEDGSYALDTAAVEEMARKYREELATARDDEQIYTRLAALLNAVEEIRQNFESGDLTTDMVAHLTDCANRSEIRELARTLRQAAKAADGKNP